MVIQLKTTKINPKTFPLKQQKSLKVQTFKKLLMPQQPKKLLISHHIAQVKLS